jgi:CheY-like chemotaxis protein
MAYPLRLLLAEDDALVAADLVAGLHEAGHQVVAVAARGDEAIRLAQARRPDLLLLNLRLRGGLDGVAVAQAVADTPVVFVTALTAPAARQRMALVAPLAVLAKPLGRTQLQQVLADWARERRG